MDASYSIIEVMFLDVLLYVIYKYILAVSIISSDRIKV